MKAREIAGQDVKNLPDEEILAISLVSPSVFEILVDRYQSAFLRKAGSIVKRKEEAEDATQETFVKIYLNAKKFKKEKAGDSFKNWAYKILVNCAISRYGKLKKEMLASSPLDIGDSGEKALNFSGDYSERENLEIKMDNQNFVSGIFGQIAQGIQRGFEKYFFRRKDSQGDCRGRRHFRDSGQTSSVSGQKRPLKKAAEDMSKRPLMI